MKIHELRAQYQGVATAPTPAGFIQLRCKLMQPLITNAPAYFAEDPLEVVREQLGGELDTPLLASLLLGLVKHLL